MREKMHSLTVDKDTRSMTEPFDSRTSQFTLALIIVDRFLTVKTKWRVTSNRTGEISHRISCVVGHQCAHENASTDTTMQPHVTQQCSLRHTRHTYLVTDYGALF
jgi:hypothetical protein